MWHLEKIIEMNKPEDQPPKEKETKSETEDLLLIQEEIRKSKELLLELRDLVKGTREILKNNS